MNILITGGAGYVGGAVTDLLMQGKHNFRVYDALLYEECYRKPIDLICGDVRDRKALLPHLKWADVVIWLAALVGDGVCAMNPDTATEINQQAVEWLAQNYDGRIIFTSTASVYGAQRDMLDETALTRPLSVYASTKLKAEEALAGKNVVIFRLGTLYGIGDMYSRIRLDLVVNTLTVRAYRVGKISVYGGEQYRPILHIRDVAQVIVDNIGTEYKGIFNLASENIRIIQIAELVKTEFPDLQIEHSNRTFEDTRNYRIDCALAKEVLHFGTKYTAIDGIRELKELLQSGRLRNPDSERYTNEGHLFAYNVRMGT